MLASSCTHFWTGTGRYYRTMRPVVALPALTSAAAMVVQAGLNEEEAKELVRACIKQLHTRFLMHQPSFKVKVVDKNGVRELDGF